MRVPDRYVTALLLPLHSIVKRFPLTFQSLCVGKADGVCSQPSHLSSALMFNKWKNDSGDSVERENEVHSPLLNPSSRCARIAIKPPKVPQLFIS